MKRSELDYPLPAERIAQSPASPRDASRLMIVNRERASIEHRVFREIGTFLRPGDLMVVNDTRVLPARFFCRRESGGRIEGLFLRIDEDGSWHSLLSPSARLKAGETLRVGESGGLELIERGTRGAWRVRAVPACDPETFLNRHGQTPLPPYMKHALAPTEADRDRYQTVYAASPGAVAAPTAGLHFTPELLAGLAAAGVRRAGLTLHVGLGTFAPVEVEDLSDHPMHSEWIDVPGATLRAVMEARAAGGRIVAIGTTSVRALEAALGDERPTEADGAVRGWTNLLIQPPYRFRAVDVLLTNFHLPGSTLLALVMALAGVELTRRAYDEAIREGYRFFSYGDAMLIV